ncbi:MAG: type II toxin-antitoxin system RelE/ParE family toxin [Candidatus Aenigmarchaeota archaeon]|nr:type II toxin-antitoxin system RelE/ParE family toxin [Candidatus Aenigmarchaeota archaeon]
MTEINLSQEFAKEFSDLQRRIEKGDGEAEHLLKLIEKGIAKLIENHESGQKIRKNLWPKYYVNKYGINNLWKLRLDDYWRMIYTIIGEQVRIVAVILEVMNHKEYDKRFGYK